MSYESPSWIIIPKVSIIDIKAIIFVTNRVYLYLIQLAKTTADKNMQAKHKGNGAYLSGPGIHLSLAAFKRDPCSHIYAFNSHALPAAFTC
jgi:hypothetical protein